MIGKWQSRTDAKRIVRGEVGIGDTPPQQEPEGSQLGSMLLFYW
jgi:hypothetical protein